MSQLSIFFVCFRFDLSAPNPFFSHLLWDFGAGTGNISQLTQCCLSVEGAGGTLQKEGACFLSLVPAGGVPGGFRRPPGGFPVSSAGPTDHLLPPALSCKYMSELCSEPQPFLSPSLKAASSNLFLPWCGRWNSKDSPLCPCPE